MSPLIGLPTYREPARWGVWDRPADLLPTTYADAVRRAGGVPVLLPPGGDADEAAAVLCRLDGLLVTGGADVDPRRYDEEADPTTGRPREDRDAWELALLDAAEALALPVLGVCRGMQVMAVHAGGDLDQHLPDLVGHAGHAPQPGSYGTTAVTIAPGTALAALVGTVPLDVPCHHHQGVRAHPGYTAVAHAPDGVLEAMELSADRAGGRFCLAVQWHPEEVADVGLFTGLVAAASAFHRPTAR